MKWLLLALAIGHAEVHRLDANKAYRIFVRPFSPATISTVICVEVLPDYSRAERVVIVNPVFGNFTLTAILTESCVSDDSDIEVEEFR